MLSILIQKLIEAPLTVGGHFQFKHEKSWDVISGPSLYDKYFEINMENLCLAISTIPFYERNSIDMTIFNESDKLSMNNRATRYKNKYFKDKSYTTPEIEAQENILKNLRDNKSENTTEIDIQESILHNLKENFDKIDEIDVDKEASIILDSKDDDSKYTIENTTDDIGLKIQEVEKAEINPAQEKAKENLCNKEKPDNINTLDIKFDSNQDFIFEKAESKPVITEIKNEPKKIAEIKPTLKDKTSIGKLKKLDVFATFIGDIYLKVRHRNLFRDFLSTWGSPTDKIPLS